VINLIHSRFFIVEFDLKFRLSFVLSTSSYWQDDEYDIQYRQLMIGFCFFGFEVYGYFPLFEDKKMTETWRNYLRESKNGVESKKENDV
jgi:hypothetical protein